MAELLKGAPVAKALTEALARETETLRGRGVVPCLAIVRVGERADDLAYERGACKRCAQIGIETRRVALRADVEQDEALRAVEALSRDEAVDGILLLRPLPPTLDEAALCAAIAPEKDVDGVGMPAMAALYAGRGALFAPCTAEACLALLRGYDVSLAGKRAVVIGRSLVIGKPVSLLLLSENATVTLCHSRTKDLPAVCREADVLIAAAGKAGLIGAEHLRPGQVVLDVGMNAAPDGTLCGDVRTEEALAAGASVSPVPGGVGAVTTSVLARHVVEAAKRRI